MIPYGRQSIDDDDIKSVINVLKSDFLTQGPKVPMFETSTASYCGSKFAVAFNSATSALHSACLALDLKKDDIVWTSPISFVASSNCALYCQAKIDFVDINLDTYNICIDKLREKLTSAKKENKLPKILIPVHLCGQSCDMKEIKKLSEIYGFKVIEDASHALGSKYFKNYVGNCSYSDITIFSFHPVKIITSGEGGMATTNSLEISNKLNLFRSHGITKDKNNFLIKDKEDWYYEQHLLGFNYRMNDIEASLGISQLKRINKFINERNNIAKIYNQAFKDLPFKTPSVLNHNLSSFHLYVLLIEEEVFNKRDDLFRFLREKNILVNLHYYPIHLQPYYQNLGFKFGDFPLAEDYSKRAISLPIYPDLQKDEQEFVINTIYSFFK